MAFQDVTGPTLGDFLATIVPTYVQGLEHTLDECQSYTQRIKSDAKITLANKDNIYRKEQEYHCDGNHDLALDVDQALEIFEFNDYVPGYKLLTKRTQEYIFSKCMMAHFPETDENGKIPAIDISAEPTNPTPLQAAVNKLCDYDMIDWLKYCVLSHPDVEAIMKPIADKYQAFVTNEISRLDDIPHVEQKTEEWHAIRKNMVSASVAGYIDSVACGCNLSHERGKMEEKCGVKQSRPFSWGCVPLRHGQQYEDVSGHMYDTFNRLESKEYGILPDHRYNWLGASPDGIITHVKKASTTVMRRAMRSGGANGNNGIEGNDVGDSDSYLDKAYLGRMREIKNPVSRAINDKIPSYYYWQMLQQMYVCQLPMCDFIQTMIKYPQNCKWQTYINDTMPAEVIDGASHWSKIQKLLSPYVLENIDWPIMNLYLTKDYKLTSLNPILLQNAPIMLAQTMIANFKEVTHIAPENINRRGQVKGVLWCFTREDDNGEVDFRVEFSNISKAANNEEAIYLQECMYVEKHMNDGGFKLSEKHYWNVEEYKVTEVEYNQGLYEGLARFCHPSTTPVDDYHKDNCIISRLRHKWDIVEELRAIDDLDLKKAKFEEYYPPSKGGGRQGWKADNATAAKNSKTTAFGNPKYKRRAKSKQPRIRSAFNLD